MSQPPPGQAVRPDPAGVAVMIAVVAVALNLRPALAAVGPVLDRIAAAAGLTSTGAGLLTTLPVFLMGLGALVAAPIRRRLGERRGVALGVAVIAAACAVRPLWPISTALLASAAAAGVGIAMVQALTPGFIKRVFRDRAGRVMGLYSTAIMGGAALAAASAAGLSRTAGWAMMLGLWALPAGLALIVWRSAAPRDEQQEDTASNTAEGSPPWRSRRAWLLMLFFGVGTAAYALVLAWLPPFYVGLGRGEDVAGYLLSGLTVMEVVAGLAVSALIDRFPDRRGPLVAALLAILGGLACLLAAPLSLAAPAIVLLGLGIGALFPLSLLVTLDHADSPAQVAPLTTFVQGGGYVIASLAPFAAGWARGQFADLSLAWLAMAVGVGLLLLIARCFAPGDRIDRAALAEPSARS